jgi:hypothetical protein
MVNPAMVTLENATVIFGGTDLQGAALASVYRLDLATRHMGARMLCVKALPLEQTFKKEQIFSRFLKYRNIPHAQNQPKPIFCSYFSEDTLITLL